MAHSLIDTCVQIVVQGGSLTMDHGLDLACLGPEHTLDLLYGAWAIVKAKQLSPFTCAIVNAKSGTCSQDCTFCAQSKYYQTQAPVHPLLPVTDLVARGLAMHEAGASCFSLVTSGLALNRQELDRVCQCISTLKAQTNLSISASLGLLTPEAVRLLVAAGLDRYHHNLETAPSYFQQICTTHSYDQDLETIALAQEQGLEVCCGGILGLGESWAQRIELAAILADLKVQTIPLNFLNPIAGTPLGNTRIMSVHDALKSIALFRFMLADKNITIAGGRERVLGDYQSWITLAGANGLMIGNYLTTQGRALAQDQSMWEQGLWI